MSTGVGEVAAGAATLQERRFGAWRERLVVALGGAVVAVVAVLLVMSWSTGLRASTFQQLQSDIADGSVQQWYAAERFESGPLDVRQAPASTVRGDLDEGSEGVYLPPAGDPLGGILVWRTWGEPGWRVASESGVSNAADGDQEAATEVSTALVGQLRAAQVPMKPYEFSDGGWVSGAVTFGGLALFVFLVAGPSPRVGTRWFWFWVVLTLPAASGVVAYAVLELIGLRRRPDRPLDRRISGLRGFLGSILVSMVVLAVAHTLRDNGVPLPL
ncbi:hypothetical protein [Knoellia sp. LjRoot47]|uniref:hypothetical protein n=1 Tax=Knoellia sp. LjRoot47 TaxID=3342330 RepID=UPI003ECD4489